MAAPPEQGQLDASPTLFAVMAAINAAGYSADLSSPNNSPLRGQVRTEIIGKNPPSLPALKEFFDTHHKHGAGSDTAELSQYISFALSVKGPPDFVFTQRDVDIPPDVVPLKSLSPLLARFYREANIQDLWQRAQPAIDREIDRLHDPVADAVLHVNAYLRHVASGIDRSHFQIYVEPLAAPNQVQARSYGYEFTVVVTPAPQPRAFDIRHEYLHYLLDPLSTLQQEVLDRKKILAEEAQRAPAPRFLQRSPRRRRGKSCAATATDASHSQRPPPGQNAWRQFRKMRGPMAANPDQFDMENLVVDAGGLGAP